MLLQPLVMSKQHWDKLTPAQKKIFEEAAAKSDEFFLKLQKDAVDKMEEAYKKAGAKVHEMTQAEYDQWVALAKETSYKEFAAKSPEAKQLLDALSAGEVILREATRARLPRRPRAFQVSPA